MNAIISRKEAQAAGLPRYFTGAPCKYGHVSERLVSTRKCCACNVAHVINWQASNKDKKREYDRRWRSENADKAKAAVLRWHAENRASVRANNRAFFARNPGARVIQEAKRRAAKRDRVPVWFGELDRLVMREAADLAILRERATGLNWHIDHMIPLQARNASGLHCAANLQVIPAILNIKKQNRMAMTSPGEWVRYV